MRDDRSDPPINQTSQYSRGCHGIRQVGDLRHQESPAVYRVSVVPDQGVQHVLVRHVEVTAAVNADGVPEALPQLLRTLQDDFRGKGELSI